MRSPELLALVTAAETTHDAIEAIAQVITGQRDTVDRLSAKLLDTLNSGRTKADALGEMVEETIGRTHLASPKTPHRVWWKRCSESPRHRQRRCRSRARDTGIRHPRGSPRA